MKKQYHILCLFIILLFPETTQGASEFYFSQFGVGNGLSQTSVLCMYQDSEGYIWMGTRNGANKYDGHEFVIYQNEVNNPFSLSDSYITSINEDGEKNIWIATRNGLNCIDYKTGHIKRFYPQEINPEYTINTINLLFKHTNGDLYAFGEEDIFLCYPDRIEPVCFPGIDPSLIFSVTEGSDNHLYIGTEGHGVFMYTPSQVHLATICIPDFTTLRISTLQEIKKKQWILGTDRNGFYLYNQETEEISHFHQENSSLSNNSIRALIMYKDSVLIGTFNGLNLFDCTTHEITPIKVNMQEKGSLSHFSIHSLLIDHQETLWVGTYSGGVNFYSPYFKPSSVIIPEEFTGIIGKGQQDKEGNMWFATEGAGLLLYNPHTGYQQTYPITPLASQHYEQNILKTILLKGDSIFCATHAGEIFLFSQKNKKHTKLYDFGQSDIYSLYIDSRNRLWIPTNNTLRIKNENLSITHVTVIKEIRPDLFLLGTLQDSIYLYDEKKQSLRNLADIVHPENRYETLGSITGIETDPHYIWISTTKSGLYKLDYSLNLIKHYYHEDGLPGSYISSMVIDTNGDIWITTGTFIYKLDREKDHFVLIHPPNMPSQEYTLYSASVSSDGTVYFPGNRAIHSFEPQNLAKNPHPPTIYIRKIFTDNREDITKKYLKRNQSLTGVTSYTITLPPSIRNLTIRYTALQYVHGNESGFNYKMEGIDKSWVSAGNRRVAHYSNLQPGKYIFRLTACNIDGVWNPEEVRAYIIIKPPLYKTWWAILSYLLLFSFILFKTVHYLRQKKELERELRYKQLEKTKTEELHAERMRMFQNFSHELRTPLTLIINPLNELLSDIPFSKEVKEALLLIKKNTSRLILLVNNLMDIQKYEAGHHSLNPELFDFCKFIQETYDSFYPIATNQKINYTLTNHLPGTYKVKYDKIEIEKVFFNLLSNAFKFTPSGGEVTVTIQSLPADKILNGSLIPDTLKTLITEPAYLYIEVADNGKGFSENEASKIFQPFYQAENNRSKEISGTGIGLSLSRSIVLQHKGLIWAKSTPDAGSHFFILLPDTEPQTASVQPENSVHSLLEKIEEKEKKCIIIADDEPDMLSYLEKQLEEEYMIYPAHNGKEVLHKLESITPSLIISDIIMPEMGGLELCRQIKENPQWEHIPIILLSSRSMLSHMQEGFNVKADEYITKPFDISLLKLKIQNLISLREQMQALQKDTIGLKQLGLKKPEEKEFMSQYIDIIKKHITDPELDISTIYTSLHVSRTTFYRKVKEETGLSPIELITHMRLKAGAKLLKESNMSINEVAQAVGFRSRNYFARSFKSLYGITPSEYQKGK